MEQYTRDFQSIERKNKKRLQSGAFFYAAVKPPSAKYTPPLQYEDSSEPRKRAKLAISSLVPYLPEGILAVTFSLKLDGSSGWD